MKFRKEDIVLKEAIARPDRLGPGDIIKIQTKSEKSNKWTFKNYEIISNDNQLIKLKNEQGEEFRLSHNNLDKDNETITFFNDKGNKIMIKNAIVTLEVDANDDYYEDDEEEEKGGCEIGKGVNYQLYKQFEKWLLNGNDGDVVACYFIDENTGALTKNNISFEIVGRNGGRTNLQFNNSGGYVNYDPDKLRALSDIVIGANSFQTGENCQYGNLVAMVSDGTNNDEITFEGIGGFGKATRSARGTRLDSFYDFLVNTSAGSMLELEMDGNADSNMYFELTQPMTSDEAILTLFNTENLDDSNLSDPEAFTMKDPFKLKQGDVSMSGNKMNMKLTGQDGTEYLIKNISDYMQSLKTRIEIEGVDKLSDEELKAMLANDPTFRDSVIKKPSFFASLFGAKNLGWIPILQKRDKRKYGDGFEKLKRGNTVSFVFTSDVKPPLRQGKNYVGRLEDKVTIRLTKVNISGQEYENYKIKILSGKDDVYEVEIYPTAYERTSTGWSASEGNPYISEINIRNYNLT